MKGMTPYKAWYKRKPRVDHLRTFGCVAHVKRVVPHSAKLADRSDQMVFIGYEVPSKAYRFFNPAKRKLVVSRDVVFDEGRRWDWGQVAAKEGTDVCPYFTVENFVRLVQITLLSDRIQNQLHLNLQRKMQGVLQP